MLEEITNLTPQDRELLAVKMAQAIRDFADKLEAKAAGDIVEVPVRKRESDLYGRRRTVTEMMDRAQFEATQPYYSKFDSAVESYRSQLERQAANLRREADDLEQLRDKVHGISRACQICAKP